MSEEVDALIRSVFGPSLRPSVSEKPALPSVQPTSTTSADGAGARPPSAGARSNSNNSSLGRLLAEGEDLLRDPAKKGRKSTRRAGQEPREASPPTSTTHGTTSGGSTANGSTATAPPPPPTDLASPGGSSGSGSGHAGGAAGAKKKAPRPLSGGAAMEAAMEVSERLSRMDPGHSGSGGDSQHQSAMPKHNERERDASLGTLSRTELLSPPSQRPQSTKRQPKAGVPTSTMAENEEEEEAPRRVVPCNTDKFRKDFVAFQSPHAAPSGRGDSFSTRKGSSAASPLSTRAKEKTQDPSHASRGAQASSKSNHSGSSRPSTKKAAAA